MAFTHDTNRLCTTESLETARLKVESSGSADEYVLQGRGYYSEWIETSIAQNASVYSRFIVPAGFYLNLAFREITTNKEELFYRVYPATSATIDTVGNAIDVRNLRTDKPDLAGAFNLVTLTAAPTGNPDITIPVFGSETTGNRSSGNTATEVISRLIAPGSELILELENGSGSAIHAQASFVFILIPESEID